MWLQEIQKNFEERGIHNVTLPLEFITDGQICTLTKASEGSCTVC